MANRANGLWGDVAGVKLSGEGSLVLWSSARGGNGGMGVGLEQFY